VITKILILIVLVGVVLVVIRARKKD